MQLPKVYLAKSNKANPDLVSKTRQILSKFNIEIVEFTGGHYSHDKMLECDMLVVVPYIDSRGEVVIGKGLFDQMETFEETYGDDYICVVSNENIKVSEVHDIHIMNHNDYVNYAIISFSKISDDLEDILQDCGYGFKSKSELASLTSMGSKNSYYVLIAKKR